jgi:hypothetical protein
MADDTGFEKVEHPDAGFEKHDPVADKLPPSDPSFGEEMLAGFTAPVRGAAQLAEHVLPSRAATAQQSGEGTVKAPKVKQGQPDEGSLGYTLGSMIGPAGAVGTTAKFAPRIITPMTRAMAAGGISGALQPVEDEEHFWQEKSKQAAEGMTLGYGFSVAGKAASVGVNALGKWLAKTMPENMENSAIAAILQRIDQGHKYGAPSAQDMLDIMSASDKPLMLADMPSPNLRSLGGRVTRAPGESRAIATQALTERDKGPSGTPLSESQNVGASGRLNEDIAKHVSSGPSMYKTVKGMLDGRSAAARPAYAASDELQGIWSPRLQQFLDNPDVAKGMAMGYHFERNMALAEDRPFDPTMMGIDLDEQGNIKLLRTPNMRVLDMAKQGLDAMIADNRDPLTGRLNKMGLSLEKVRQAYIGELDALDTKGIYKKARETWQGYSASMDAVRLGQSAFSRTAEENQDMFSRLSDADKQFSLIGLADKLKERLLKSGFNSDESRAVLSSPWMVGQIKPFFKTTKDFDSFVKAVGEERQMAQSNTTYLGGSQTAERTAEDKSSSMVGSGVRLAKNALEGKFFSSIRDLVQLHRDMKAKPDPALDSEIAKIMFSPNIYQTPMGQRLIQPLPPPIQHMLSGRTAPNIQDIFAPAAAGTSGGMLPSNAPSTETVQ